MTAQMQMVDCVNCGPKPVIFFPPAQLKKPPTQKKKCANCLKTEDQRKKNVARAPSANWRDSQKVTWAARGKLWLNGTK